MIARALHLSPAAGTALLDRLVSRGLIDIEPHAHDRRKKLVRPFGPRQQVLGPPFLHRYEWRPDAGGHCAGIPTGNDRHDIPARQLRDINSKCRACN